MDLQELGEAVHQLHSDIEAASPGAPELADLIRRGTDLQRELERTSSAQGALIPDASAAATANEQSVVELERALRALLSAAHSKQ